MRDDKLPSRVDWYLNTEEGTPVFLKMGQDYPIDCEATYEMRNTEELACTPNITLYIGDKEIEVHKYFDRPCDLP